MTFDALKQNIERIKEIARELYVFTNQLDVIDALEKGKEVVINIQEKKLLKGAIDSLIGQLRILNNSIPELAGGVGFFKKLGGVGRESRVPVLKKPLVQIKYKPSKSQEKVSITISEQERREFLENLSRSNLSINQLKKKYAVERPITRFGKPNLYAKISNRFFKKFSNKLLAKGYLEPLNKDLRQMNSPFVVTTYCSMIFFTMAVAAIAGFFLFIILLFYNFSFIFPFLSPVEEGILLRFVKIFWIVLAIPFVAGVLIYFYPKTEGKNMGEKINQELPFVAIHISAIASSGVQPLNIFKIIVRSEEYKHTRTEFNKLLNLTNFQGYDLATALKKVAKSTPSSKLRELFEGLATTITSGGSLHDFLNEHARSLLFDYRIEREKYTKTSETFMDIYISIAIAAPMILLMLFVIMGSTGLYFLGLTTPVMSLLIILIIIFLNIGFLIFLRLKQPVF